MLTTVDAFCAKFLLPWRCDADKVQADKSLKSTECEIGH